MKIFFDTEFTGLHKDTSLISIGLASEDGQMFYAELFDYNQSQIDEWIQKNVIDHLYLHEARQAYLYSMEMNLEHGWEEEHIFPCGKEEGNLIEIVGNKQSIGHALNCWLERFDVIEWVSDVCHYDFVLLIDLIYGHALNIPYGKHNAACHDINQDIAKYYNISEIQSFDKSREDILIENSIQIDGDKHNALYDAKVIKEIYNIVNR